jgi:hypothetical protein
MTEFPIERRDLLQATGAGVVALGFTGASSGSVSTPTALTPPDSDVSVSVTASDGTKFQPGDRMGFEIVTTNLTTTAHQLRTFYSSIMPCCHFYGICLFRPDFNIPPEQITEHSDDDVWIEGITSYWEWPSVGGQESRTTSLTLKLPEDIEPGSYNIGFGAQLRPCPDPDSDAPSPSTATDSVEVTVKPGLELTAQNGVAIDEQAGVGYVLEDSKVVKFDLASRERIDSYQAPDGTDQGLAYGAGSLWYSDAATDAYDGQILKLAPDTGEVRSEIITKYDPYGLAYGDGSLWVAEVTGVPNNVYEYSTALWYQIGSFDIGGPAGSKGPQSLAYYNGSVWVGTDSALYELGPNGSVVQEINEHDGGYKGLAGTSTALYGPDGDGTLTVVLGNEGSNPTGSLALEVQADTAPSGGTYTLTYQITNTGSTTIGDGDDSSPVVSPDEDQRPPGIPTKDITEISLDGGRIDAKTWYDWTIDPGETLQANLEVELPDDIDPGEYEFIIKATQGSTEEEREYDRASGTVTVNEGSKPGEPSWTLTAQAFQPFDGPGPLPAQPGETFRLPLVITNTGTVSGDASLQFVSASSGEHNADYYGDQFTVESHTDDGGEWFFEGWRWDENTDSGPIAPDETREPVVELAVAEDVSAGEYTFAISGPDGAMATATVPVAPLDGTRQQKLALAGRIDDAATFASLLTREPSTRAFQPEQEVARNSLDLLEESVPDGSLSRETAIDAANRLIWGEQLTEDVLQYTGDTTITTNVTELPDDLNIAQQTAVPLLKVVVSILLQTKAASKIVSSVSQRLPAGVSIDPSQIEGVAKNLLDIALGFNSETDDVPADAPDTTDPTTLLENLRPEVATIVEEIENGVTTSVDAVLSSIDTVVQPFIDLAAGTLRVFLEHIALAGAVTEGIDAGLAGAVTNLHSALRPASIASGGLAGSQSQAEEARSQAVADIGQIAIESADVLDGFGTQEKLRDSTELAVNVLKLEPEEIDITTIVEFSIGQIREIPYGEALDLGLGIGFMLNLHASHSNAHTGIINGA